MPGRSLGVDGRPRHEGRDAEPPGGEDFQTNLIMSEPCPFLNRRFPVCSIIRPTKTKGAAMRAVKALTADGLFIGQSKHFFELLRDLAEDADKARREMKKKERSNRTPRFPLDTMGALDTPSGPSHLHDYPTAAACRVLPSA
jgi:hypothetical protein